MKSLKLVLGILVLVLLFGFNVSRLSANENNRPVCLPNAKGEFHCNSKVIVESNGSPKTTNLPSGYGPAQFLGGYGLTGIACEYRSDSCNS